jgi:hypothetical protein
MRTGRLERHRAKPWKTRRWTLVLKMYQQACGSAQPTPLTTPRRGEIFQRAGLREKIFRRRILAERRQLPTDMERELYTNRQRGTLARRCSNRTGRYLLLQLSGAAFVEADQVERGIAVINESGRCACRLLERGSKILSDAGRLHRGSWRAAVNVNCVGVWPISL